MENQALLPIRSSISGPVALLGRLLFVLIFLRSGFVHFQSQTIAYAASKGVPLASIAVPLSGVFAFAAGLLILLGYRAKLGAWMMALFLIAATPVMHNFWTISDPLIHLEEYVQFLKNLSMLGVALFITQVGSGPWSLDDR